jgi:RNA recognition motif-containing protein
MKLRGLPFSATKETICEFFSDYDIVRLFHILFIILLQTKSDVVIEENYGKKTGFGLVFFPNQDLAQLAKKDKNKKMMGSRYVEILECTLQDMF